MTIKIRNKMDIIRKIQYLLFCLLAIGFVACDDDDNNSTETGHEGILTQLAEEVDATALSIRTFTNKLSRFIQNMVRFGCIPVWLFVRRVRVLMEVISPSE